VVTRQGRISAGLGRQVRGRRCDRLDAGLLVIGDDRHCVARLRLRLGRAFLQDFHFAIDAQNLRHLLLELRIAALQVGADLVRLHLLLIEDLAQRALSQLAEGGLSFGGSVLARVASQKPRRPQFVGIAQVLRLAAGERHQPCLGLGGDSRLLARSRTIVERRHWTIGQRPLDTALNRLMMHPQSATHRKERGVFPVGQHHPRPLDPSRRLGSRAGNRAQRRQILLANRQFDRPPQPRHDQKTSLPNQSSNAKGHIGKMNPAHRIGFKESMN
jgi:hypothetical protein